MRASVFYWRVCNEFRWRLGRVLQIRTQTCKCGNQGRTWLHIGNEQGCSFKTLVYLIYFNAITAEVRFTGSLWVSGTNAGKGCDNTYGWCGSKKLFYDNFTWSQNEPSLPFEERCVALNLAQASGQGGFVDSQCSQVLGFVCEVISLCSWIFLQ